MATSAVHLNCSQVSLDSSHKFIDIQSKCSVNGNDFSRIVGAVTILFTDNSINGTEWKGTHDELSSLKVWRNIPSTLSVLPSPNNGTCRSVGFESHFVQYSSNDNQESFPDGREKETFRINQDSLIVKQEPQSPSAETSSFSNILPSLQHDNFLTSTPGKYEETFHSSQNERGVLQKSSSPKCQVCFRNIHNRKEFNFHSKNHTNVFGGKETCPICLKSFQRRVHLLRHAFVHFRNALFCCPVCHVKIVRLDSFRRHFHKRHPASLPQLRWYLANHKTTRTRSHHQDNGGQGDQSSQGEAEADVSVQEEAVVVHNQSMKVDIDAEGLERVNIISAVDEGLQAGPPSVSSPSNSKRQAQSGFIKRSSAKKTSRCSFCWSEMKNLEEFLDHMDAHKPIMKVPFTCPVCLHEFNDKMRVKRHASRHVQTDMYVCPMCDVEVPRVDSFRRHVRKVHGLSPDDINIMVKQSMSQSSLNESASTSFIDPYSQTSPDGMTSLSMKAQNTTQETMSFTTDPLANITIKQEVTEEEDNSDTSYNIQPENENSLTTDAQISSTNQRSPEGIDDVSSAEEMQFQPLTASNTKLASLKGKKVVTETPSSQDVSESGDGFLPGMTFVATTFKAPKRGGYRGNKNTSQTSAKSETPGSSSQASAQGQSVPGQKPCKKMTSTCFFCSAVLTNVTQFLHHASIHGEHGKITCPVCVTDYARKLGLVRHSVNHVPCDTHTCDICGTAFARRDVMLRHYRKVHKMSPTYIRSEASTRESGPTETFAGDDLPILSFDSISAPSIPPMPGDGEGHLPGVGMMEEDDMMYSCGLCGAQYHDAQTLQEHVQNHPHDI